MTFFGLPQMVAGLTRRGIEGMDLGMTDPAGQDHRNPRSRMEPPMNLPLGGNGLDILGELIRAEQERIEAIGKKGRRTQGPTRQRRRTTRTTSGSGGGASNPLADAMAGGVGGPSMSAKDKQKAINEAILAARAPYDQAIVEARAGLKGALAANKRVAAEIAPTGKPGQERDAAYRAQAQAAADAMAADMAANNDVQVAGGGGAAARAAAADDIGQAVVRAQQAGTSAQSQSQAQMGTEQATGLDHFLTAKASETAGTLQRDTARNIARLQRERAASIAGAKSTTRTQLEQALADAQAAATQAKNAQIDQAIKIMGLQMRQQEHAAKMRQQAQGDPLDVIKVLNGMTQDQVRVQGPDGKWGYAPTYPTNPLTGAPAPEIGAIAGMFPYLQGTPWSPTPAQQTMNMGSYIGNWMQNMFGGR